MSYCTLVRDSKWRGSTFHLVFCDGAAYLDFNVRGSVTDGSDTVTDAMSFDGAGCLRDCQLPVPQELSKALLDLVPNEKDTFQIPEESPIAVNLKSFFASKEQDIPEQWRQDFRDNGVF